MKTITYDETQWKLVPQTYVDAINGASRIASAYAPSIDAIDEAGGENADNPTWAIHHRLHYASFMLDRTPPAVEQPGARDDRASDILRATKAALTDPNIVHINMCRGIIAPITFDQLAHVLGDDAKHEWLARQASAQDRKDAERWRWVRARWGRIFDTYEVDSDRISKIEEDDQDLGWDIDSDSLDAAVDAARAAKGES